MSDPSRQADDGHAPLPGARQRLATLSLDPASITRGNANIEHERDVAIFDILEANHFELVGRDDGPYGLVIGVADDRLEFVVSAHEAGVAPVSIILPMVPLRRVMKDYFLVCETYFEAIKSAPPSRIQQIDAGRRALHDEGAKALSERLADRVTLDVTTARRLFTLVCALHWRG